MEKWAKEEEEEEDPFFWSLSLAAHRTSEQKEKRKRGTKSFVVVFLFSRRRRRQFRQGARSKRGRTGFLESIFLKDLKVSASDIFPPCKTTLLTDWMDEDDAVLDEDPSSFLPSCFPHTQ